MKSGCLGIIPCTQEKSGNGKKTQKYRLKSVLDRTLIEREFLSSKSKTCFHPLAVDKFVKVSEADEF